MGMASHWSEKEIERRAINMKNQPYRPIISYIGLILIVITLVVNMCVRFRISSDPGIGIMLSLLNVLLLVSTLLWSLPGIYEFYRLLTMNKCIRSKYIAKSLSEEEYESIVKSIRKSFVINVS